VNNHATQSELSNDVPVKLSTKSVRSLLAWIICAVISLIAAIGVVVSLKHNGMFGPYVEVVEHRWITYDDGIVSSWDVVAWFHGDSRTIATFCTTSGGNEKEADEFAQQTREKLSRYR